MVSVVKLFTQNRRYCRLIIRDILWDFLLYLSGLDAIENLRIAQKYLADCKINYDKKTFDEKKYCLERFYKFTEDISVLDIDPPIIL